MERFVNGKCVSAPHAACDDLQVCTLDTCDEELQRCKRVMHTDATLPGQGCSRVASCRANGDEECVPDCNGKECGGDGCGGVCGPLAGACPNQQSCNSTSKCIVNSVPGSCSNPYRLYGDAVPFLGRHKFDLDTSLGLQSTIATCNPLATAGQIMVTFTTPASEDGKGAFAIDARLSNGIGAESTLDTILELREGHCYDDPANPFTLDGEQQNVWCSDDASPPGGVGSRVVTTLKPGTTYYLVSGGYNSETVGPATLVVTFVQNYIPSCLSRFCGPDGGGFNCGECPANEVCDEFLHCAPAKTSDFCTTNRCDGGKRVCGSDSCGGFCGPDSQGKCPHAGELCIVADGTCGNFTQCDHLHPQCTGCTINEFCASDCQCHAYTEEFADLVPDRQRLLDSLLFDEVAFDNITCAWHEGCVTGTGIRKLLRFDTTTINQGNADLVLGDPTRNPAEFIFALCHNHYHFDGYAEYRLMSLDDRLMGKGHKAGYCMEDSNRQLDLPGPTVPCRPVSTCEAPGISVGYSDVYGNDIDCQWIDVTDLPPGDYILRIELNVHRRFLESNIENNAISVPVTIAP